MGEEGAVMFGETDKTGNVLSESDISAPFLLKWKKCQEAGYDREEPKGFLFIAYKTQHKDLDIVNTAPV